MPLPGDSRERVKQTIIWQVQNLENDCKRIGGREMTQEEIIILLLPIRTKLQNIVCELAANGFDGDSFTLHLVNGEVTFLIKKK